MTKLIHIPKELLDKAVSKAIGHLIQENHKKGIIVEYYARLNVKNVLDPIFPPEKYLIGIYSNDHTPPHFHIEYGDLNIAFSIWKGDILEIKGHTSQSECNYIIKNVPKWLNMRSAINKRKTNRQLLIILWNRSHPEARIVYDSRNSQYNIQNNTIKK